MLQSTGAENIDLKIEHLLNVSSFLLNLECQIVTFGMIKVHILTKSMNETFHNMGRSESCRNIPRKATTIIQPSTHC